MAIDQNEELQPEAEPEASGKDEATPELSAPPPSPELIDPAEFERIRSQLEEAQKAAEQYKDQFLRKAADFENYRRRSEADYAALVKNANENLLLALLPILDDFSRSLKAGKEQPDFKSFYRGVELISGKLVRTLENEGLVPFESAGKPFDVEYHDALLQVPRADVPPGTVVEEIERGYILNDRVLRHAKVLVSAPPNTPDQEEQKEPNG